MSINVAKSSRAVSLKAKRKKTSKLTPNDDSRHVQLITLEPQFFSAKTAYLTGMCIYTGAYLPRRLMYIDSIKL